MYSATFCSVTAVIKIDITELFLFNKWTASKRIKHCVDILTICLVVRITSSSL